MLYITALIKKITSTAGLISLLQIGLLCTSGLANASTTNAYGDNVTCGTGGTCYDFTVYDGAASTGVASPTSKGYFEAFVTYSGSGNSTSVTLDKIYFTASGIVPNGATSTPLDYAAKITNGYFDSGSIPTLRVSGATSSGLSVGQFLNTAIDFSVGNTYYQVTLNKGSAAINYSVGNTNYDSIFRTDGQITYGNSTTANGETLGASTPFGGQIAPEMSPLLSFNVFALLGCLFLLFANKKYFVKSKLQSSSGVLSIA